ncbi:hypothetical protein H8B13_02975 [Hymenobacter sp. BT188]|uniref:hypothetical protein n=1 Tax=Hymenobacter sp. BT188 TaxID=2763504 RepID=UPI001650D90C|nr:hypothetical protein [Hymenobacter sp. BT188]MBC6605770.1 hypothetical protein [Hymenobacter sp. BT188]
MEDIIGFMRSVFGWQLSSPSMISSDQYISLHILLPDKPWPALWRGAFEQDGDNGWMFMGTQETTSALVALGVVLATPQRRVTASTSQ